MRCPKCNSRSMIHDYDDVPGGRQRALLCVCCGKRVLVEVRSPTGASPARESPKR
jgi:DNA-directed RNA polymerase subunit RPC12/RpoP